MKAKDKKPIRKKADFVGVVQIPLLPEHEVQITECIPTEAVLLEYLDVAIRDGYEVSVRYDYERAIVTACIKGAFEDCTNAGLWLFGSSDTAYGALQSVLFKHFEVAQQKSWRTVAKDDTKPRFS